MKAMLVDAFADGTELVEVDVDRVDKTTDDAIHVVVGHGRAWIPRSQIDDDSEVTDYGDSGVLVVPRWLARDRDLPWKER